MNEPLSGRLIACPICASKGIKQILGKVLDNGNLIVLRFHHGTTIVTAEKYSIVCGCGQTFNVSGTVVTEYATT
jgi:hypothetical protein